MSSILRIGVSLNEKIFDAFQSLVGEKIILPQGTFFLPFREHELIFARVEEIASLTRKGHLDFSFLTRDYLVENEKGGVSSKLFFGLLLL